MSRAADARLRSALVNLLGRRHAQFSGELAYAARGMAVSRVHRSRVAARGLRSIVGTLGEALDPRLAARLRRDLRAAGLELEAVREADVRKAWLLELAAAAALPPGARAHLTEALERDCAAARRGFRRHARSVAFRERRERLAATVADRRLVARGHDLHALLARRLRRRWKRLLRSLGSAKTGLEELHRIRLRAKHARYATEALLPLLGGDAGAAVRPLRQLQACLGDHRDAHEALAWIESLGQPLGPALRASLRAPIRHRLRERLREFRTLSRKLPRPRALAVQPARLRISG